MVDEAIASRPWWTRMPEEERRVYAEAGFSRAGGIVGRPALVVIDTVKSFTGTRPMPILKAIRDEYATSCGEYAWQAIPAIASLLDAFRAAQLPVVYTRLDLSDQAAMRGATKRVADPRVAQGNDFVDEIAPLETEWICEKARASAFYGTILESYLRLNTVQTVVLCGGTTSGCVRASAADGYSAGFQVIVAEEATFDRSPSPHLANLFDIHAKYGAVMTTDDVLESVRLHGGLAATT